MEPTTSYSSTTDSKDVKCAVAADSCVMLEMEEQLTVEETEEDSEEDVFLPSPSICPKTPDFKTFKKLSDHFGKQYCSTPRATPTRTSRLGKISEEDLSIISNESSVDFRNSSPAVKSETNSFQVVLALLMLVFMIGFVCGFYLSFPKRNVTKEIMTTVQTVPNNDLNNGIKIQKPQDFESKLLVKYIDAARLDKTYRFYEKQHCVSGTPCDSVLTNHIAKEWKDTGISTIIKESFRIAITTPDATRQSFLKLSHRNGKILLCQQLYRNNINSGKDECSFLSSTVSPEVRNVPDANLTLTEITTDEKIPVLKDSWQFLPFSQSGSAQGELIYANFGTVDDYTTIAKMKIDTTGRIALIRNGLISVHDKILNAVKHGIIGVLIYNDPKETQGLPATHSLFDVTGIMSYPLASVLSQNGAFTKDEKNVFEIPVHIIKPGTAHDLLKMLNGKRAPHTWQGAFNVTYHIGRKKTSDLLVGLQVRNKQEVTTVSNVIATIKGRLYPDEIVLIGSHRTSFSDQTTSAVSSVSMATELASAMGRLLKEGWQPKRTIVLCSWAGHEYGFSGSVEWMQKHKMGLLQDVVAYISVDSQSKQEHNVHIQSSPLLRHLINKTAKKLDVQIEDHAKSLIVDGDHFPFSHHCGIPSIKIDAGMPSNKVKETTALPNLQAATKFLASVTTMLSNSDLFPFNVDTFVEDSVGYYKALAVHYGEYLNKQNISLDVLKQSIDDLSEVTRSFMHTNDSDMGQMNRKLMKLKNIFIEENSNKVIRNMMLGSKNSYLTFPRLEELLESPEVSNMQMRKYLAWLTLAFQSATEVLAW